MLDDYERPLSQLEEQLVGWAASALDLRFGMTEAVGLPPVSAGPTEVVEMLRRVRGRVDRVEGLMASATIARGRTARASKVAEARTDDAWDVSSRRIRSAPVTRGPDYTGPRERYADSNLDTLEQRRGSREAAQLAGVAQETFYVIQLCHRGLNDLRQDLLAMLRAYQVESTLER